MGTPIVRYAHPVLACEGRGELPDRFSLVSGIGRDPTPEHEEVFPATLRGFGSQHPSGNSEFSLGPDTIRKAIPAKMAGQGLGKVSRIGAANARASAPGSSRQGYHRVRRYRGLKTCSAVRRGDNAGCSFFHMDYKEAPHCI